MDAMFALAALQLSRQAPAATSRRADTHTTHDTSLDALAAASSSYDDDLDSTSRDMLHNARLYRDRARSQHRVALEAPQKVNLEAACLASLLMTLYALFMLSDGDHNPAIQSRDLPTWLRLADETSYLNDLRVQMTGSESMRFPGILFSRSALTEEDRSFEQDGGRPFEPLLTFAEDYEAMTPVDRSTYQKAVAYISLVYKGINDTTMHPLEVCYRLAAMPSRLPKRFTEQVEARTPRAMVILAHAFALIQLVSEKVFWLRGVAERQAPLIQQHLPAAWNEMMKWPMTIVQGGLARDSSQAEISTALAL
jgi:hypothetical protein